MISAFTPCLLCTTVSAHEGPPFPILMDVPADEYLVSVWTDPDIGVAKFFLILEPAKKGAEVRVPKVSMWTQPINGRLARAAYEMKRNSSVDKVQFDCQPYFDRRDFWNLGFRIETPTGQTHEVLSTVESTPPGWGTWDLVIYSFPFWFLGAAWAIGMMRRRQPGRSAAFISGLTP